MLEYVPQTWFDQWKCGEGTVGVERQAQEKKRVMTADKDVTE